MLINFWYAAELSASLSDKPVKVRLLGQNFVLFRDSHGLARCLSNVCIHRCASLADGWVSGDRVVCPYHGWEFAGSGQCHCGLGQVGGCEQVGRPLILGEDHQLRAYDAGQDTARQHPGDRLR